MERFHNIIMFFISEQEKAVSWSFFWRRHHVHLWSKIASNAPSTISSVKQEKYFIGAPGEAQRPKISTVSHCAKCLSARVTDELFDGGEALYISDFQDPSQRCNRSHSRNAHQPFHSLC